MDKKSFTDKLKEKLERIEISNKLSQSKDFTKKEFEKEAKDVKDTFEDEDISQSHSYL